MKTIEKFIRAIADGEKRFAEKILEELTKSAPCAEYAQALTKVFLGEAAKRLNEEVSGFYCDTDKLIKSMFSQMPPKTCEVVEMLCSIARENSKESARISFEKAKYYIKTNLCDGQLSVSQTAKYAETTQSNLIKLFKVYEGTTPGEYMGKLRCEESKAFLERGLSVMETAGEVGFFSCSGYIRTFKRHMGITPGEWKRNKLFL